ncbi:MAG: ankyrin repeat domain-containing protein [Candidatus Babeliales bacterium]
MKSFIKILNISIICISSVFAMEDPLRTSGIQQEKFVNQAIQLIFQASKNGDISTINLLDQQSKKWQKKGILTTPLIKIFDPLGTSPLHVAVYHGQIKAIKKLLELGADPNEYDKFKPTVLHAACANEETYEDTVYAIVKFFLNKNVNPSHTTLQFFRENNSEQPITALNFALKNKFYKVVGLLQKAIHAKAEKELISFYKSNNENKQKEEIFDYKPEFIKDTDTLKKLIEMAQNIKPTDIQVIQENDVVKISKKTVADLVKYILINGGQIKKMEVFSPLFDIHLLLYLVDRKENDIKINGPIYNAYQECYGIGTSLEKIKSIYE